jgi:replicative DNA helicase
MEKKDLQAKAFRFIDEPDITLGMIQHHIREFKMAYGVDYLIVFVDLITQVREFIDTKGKGNTNLATLIEQGVNKLNVIAKKENVCIIAFAQMNREADSAKVRSIEDLQQLRPTRNNIKNSGAIAERSRTVLSVFRERYYADQLLPNDPEVQFIPDVIEIQVLKQNMGKVGSIGKYNFNGPTFTLHELIENNEEGND